MWIPWEWNRHQTNIERLSNPACTFSGRVLWLTCLSFIHSDRRCSELSSASWPTTSTHCVTSSCDIRLSWRGVQAEGNVPLISAQLGTGTTQRHMGGFSAVRIDTSGAPVIFRICWSCINSSKNVWETCIEPFALLLRALTTPRMRLWVCCLWRCWSVHWVTQTSPTALFSNRLWATRTCSTVSLLSTACARKTQDIARKSLKAPVRVKGNKSQDLDGAPGCLPVGWR